MRTTNYVRTVREEWRKRRPK